MKPMLQIIAVLVLFIFFLNGCNNHSKPKVKRISKFSESDKFKENIVESQYFNIQSSKDNIIESKNENLIIIPENAFLDSNGNPVKDSVQIEFAEASEPDEMILANLVIRNSEKITETHSVFFINATRNGEQLRINKQHPIYIEISANKPMHLTKGKLDSLGNMVRDTIIAPVKYLLPVPFEMLNFYPEGFEREIEKGLPFRNHKILTKELSDSLYYSFAGEIGLLSNQYDYDVSLLAEMAETDSTKEPTKKDTAISIDRSDFINPASIKTIRNKKFQNTLLATREFENRIRSIFATCDSQILELYINNLNKNLWEIDRMAAERLGKKHEHYSKFLKFASYKQTKVEITDKKAQLLAAYYLNKKAKIEKDLQKLQLEFLNKRKKLDDIAQAKTEEYRTLLHERFVYRLKKFGFELTNFGWYNSDFDIELSQVKSFELNVEVKNGNQYDRVHTYVVNPKIKSIFSLLSIDKVHFDYAYFDDPILLLWKNQEFNVISIGYLQNKIGYQAGKFIQQPVINVNLTLANKTMQDLKKDLKQFTRNYNYENSINVDLEYQAFFYKEKKRKEKEHKENLFIDRLRKNVFPCRYLSIRYSGLL